MGGEGREQVGETGAERVAQRREGIGTVEEQEWQVAKGLLRSGGGEGEGENGG